MSICRIFNLEFIQSFSLVKIALSLVTTTLNSACFVRSENLFLLMDKYDLFICQEIPFFIALN